MAEGIHQGDSISIQANLTYSIVKVDQKCSDMGEVSEDEQLLVAQAYEDTEFMFRKF